MCRYDVCLAMQPEACSDGQGSWALFNDAKVTPATEETVTEAEAFVLLYELSSCD